MIRGNVRVKANRLPAIAGQLERRVGAAVDETLESIRDGAVDRSPRRTGYLAGSWDIHKDRSTAGAMYSAAVQAGLVEYGTVKMPARPAATPAAEVERHRFTRRIVKALRGLR